MSRFWKFLKRFVLFVVLVVVALVAYSYLQDKITGPPPSESNLSDLRSLNTALKTYRTAYGRYPDSLAELGMPKRGPSSDQAAGLLGSKLAAGNIHGYLYTYAKSANGYEIHADPNSAESQIHLYTNESAEIRMERKRTATRASRIAQ